MGWRYGVD